MSWRRLWLALGTFMLLVALTALWLASSRDFARWLVRQLQPLGLHVARVEGSLLHGLDLLDLSYQDATTTLRIGHAGWRLQPGALLRGQIHLSDLTVSDVDWRYRAGANPDVAVGPLSLPRLPFAIRLDRLRVEKVRMQINGSPLSLDRLDATLHTEGPDLVAHIETLRGMGARASADLRLALGDPLAYKLSLDWRYDGQPDLPLAGYTQVWGDLARLELAHRFTEPAAGTLHGEVTLGETPVGDLQGEWPLLGWPLGKVPDWSVAGAKLRVTGALDDYAVTLGAELKAADGVAGHLDLKARGHSEGLPQLDARLVSDQGTLRARGSLVWLPHAVVDLALTGSDLNPAHWQPDWPAKIDLDSRITGRLQADGPHGEFFLHRLSGTLRGHALEGEGKLRIAGKVITADPLHVTSAGNEVNLQGSLGERLALDFSLLLADPGALTDDLKGRLQARGKLRGSRDAPSITLQVTGSDLRWRSDAAMTTVAGEMIWNPQQSTGNVRARGLRVGAWGLDEVHLTLGGSPGAHQLNGEFLAKDLRATVALNGSLADRRWRGRVDRADLWQAQAGEWRLAAPTLLALDASAVRLAQSCWRQAAQQVCLQAQWRQGAAAPLDVRLNLEAIDLAALAPWLPENLTLLGVLDGNAVVRGAPDEPVIDVETAATRLTLRLQQDASEVLERTLNMAPASLHYGRGGGRARFAAQVGEQGELSGELRLGTGSDGWPLGGKLKVQLPELDLLTAAVPQLDPLRGQALLDLTLGGRLGKPTFDGRLSLRAAEAAIPELGLNLANLALDIDAASGGPLRLQGSLQSGGGELTLSGTVDPSPAHGWPFDLFVKGRNIAVVRLPEAVVDTDPDLHISGSVSQVVVAGKLHIPRAQISIRELPEGTVEPSPDEVIVSGVNEARQLPAGKSAAHVSAQVTVSLGQAVRISGYGLESRLEGAVELASDGAAAPQARGTVAMKEGTNQFHGQGLEVEQGKFLFAGSATNPTVDLRAFRLSNDHRVKAWLQVSGTLQDPIIRVSSDPPLGDAAAFAYLVTGAAPPRTGSANYQALLREAAFTRGLQGFDPLLGKVRRGLGVDELRIVSGGSVQQSGLTVGKYLSPDLYVSYVVGLFDREAAVVMRYRLTDRLSLEARSTASANGGEVVYEVEK